MQLSLAIHPVTSIQFGARTGLVGTTLSIQQDELRRLVLEESSFAAVDFELARPGDSLRAGPIFDIVEPRAKARAEVPIGPAFSASRILPAAVRPMSLRAPQWPSCAKTHPASRAALLATSWK